ncbi:MAG TPA: FecR family protein [Candidatus Paceibacterota bacterium]|nr:FecR family protein [Candidatus Paceibacterota bacterium]HMO82991.1 FecR family protein [Candidatus Paceibacterota bacterium]
MKKVVLAGAGVIVLLGLGLMFLEPKAEVPTELQTETKSAALLLHPLATDVSVGDAAASWRVIDVETKVVNGDRIKTSASGRALITQDSDIVTSIDNNSELVVEVGEDNKSTILKLAAGQTWTKINRALEQDEVYEVHTPTIVAAVRGTSFGVKTDPASQITVTEGTVWASLIDEATGEIDPTTTVAVLAGKIVIYVDGKLEVRDIEDKDKGDWYYEHNPEEEEKNSDTDSKAKEKEVDVVTEEASNNREEQNDEAVPVMPKKVTVTSVSPKVLDQKIPGGRLTLRGEFLGEVEKITVDRRVVEFTLTSASVIVINGAELPDKEGTYDITLYYKGEELFLREAFSVVNSEVGLKIESAAAGQTESPEDFIELKGTGFSKVKTVFVNGKTNEFVSINDQLMHIFDYTFSRAKTIKLVAPDSEVTYTAL